ncbi:hypothetical protein [Amycolatopsis sp. NPDC021455]|uniref:hypothetical protein n=1 Tax=Amycolatopsis sp. NPDC021455 TaxID=3154901 RepID=UPI0033C926E9
MKRLVEIASKPIGLAQADEVAEGANDLRGLLGQKNGFYAFESALHVFPSGAPRVPGYSLQEWNAPDLWLASYGRLAPAALFFAEDLFGCQFALVDHAVYSFNPETAQLTHFSDDLDEWEQNLLARYNHATGYSVGHEWQLANGALLPGHRLVPRIPFVGGGDYSADNMVPVESAAALRYWGNFANKVANLEDGAQLHFSPADIDSLKCAKWSGVGPAECRCFERSKPASIER